MTPLINIDVPDLAAAVRFYRAAFGLTPTRRIGDAAVELAGWPTPVYLLRRAEHTATAGRARRSYARHWTPLHLDVVVDDIRTARDRAAAAGAIVEGEIATDDWGSLVALSDPFGHGFCLIQFHGDGYGAISSAADDL